MTIFEGLYAKFRRLRFSFMKSYLLCLLLLSLFYMSCAKKDDQAPAYSCEADYIHFIDANTARINFIVSLEGVEKNYIVDANYQKQNNNFDIGDDLIAIENFTQRGDAASFDFYYGANLGAFCKQLFNAIPAHTHQAFNADADLDLNSKNVGKWKIKRRSPIDQ